MFRRLVFRRKYSLTHSVGEGWDQHEHQWCTLCQEPYVREFEKHVGKRDHNCMQVAYDAICHSPRRWLPLQVWESLSGTPVLQSANVSFDILEKQRREKLLGVLFFLKRRGVLTCLNGPAPQDGMSFRRPPGQKQYGGMYNALIPYTLQNEYVLPAITRLFPMADAQQWVKFCNQSIAVWNVDKVWDLLNMSSLLDGPHAGNINMAGKMLVTRYIIYELYDLTSDPHTHSPNLTFPQRFTGVEHTLADFVVRSLASEMLFTKVMDYVLRAEDVWRMYGCKLSTYNDPESPTPPAKALAQFRDDVETHMAKMKADEKSTATSEQRQDGRGHPKSIVLQLVSLTRLTRPSFPFEASQERAKNVNGKETWRITLNIAGLVHRGEFRLTVKEAERDVYGILLTDIQQQSQKYANKGLVIVNVPSLPF